MLTPISAEPETGAHRPGEPLSADDEAAVGALPAGSALLIVQRGPNAGSRFLLDVEVVTAGRHPDSDIFLDDVTVSRRHAEFRRDPHGVKVRDVGSLNGTYVNRDRIDEVQLTERRRGPDRQVPAGLLRQWPGLIRAPLSPPALTPTGPAGGRGIGEVLQVLQAEFADVTISKIRFLEAEGLVTPARTASGYRKFSAADLDRLRYVLTAQRDQYLPLKVIKEHLGAIDRGLQPSAAGAAGRAEFVAADTGAAGR